MPLKFKITRSNNSQKDPSYCSREQIIKSLDKLSNLPTTDLASIINKAFL